MSSPFVIFLTISFKKMYLQPEELHHLQAEDNKNYYEELLEKDLSFSLYTIYYIQSPFCKSFFDI